VSISIPESEPRTVIDDENPWPGLSPFDEAAQHFFNGRGEETAALRRLVYQAPLTTLYSISGLGKTSLLKAGLFPLLRRERILPIYIRLNVVDRVSPLIQQVKAAFERELANRPAPKFEAEESLWSTCTVTPWNSGVPRTDY